MCILWELCRPKQYCYQCVEYFHNLYCVEIPCSPYSSDAFVFLGYALNMQHSGVVFVSVSFITIDSDGPLRNYYALSLLFDYLQPSGFG